MRLIDADALLEYAWDADTRCGYVEVVDVGTIEEAPTIDLVKHGKWVHPKKSVVMNDFFCSECNHEEISHREAGRRGGEVHYADENGDFYLPPRMNYCPNCGARMDGE